MSAHRSKLVAYAVLSWPSHAVAYVVAPLLVSMRGARRGWKDGRPGPLNLAGCGLLAAGAGLIAWAITSHYQASPERLQARARPTYLVTRGAYGFTRNPLYLGGATMWAGWAALFGSARVAAAGSALFGLVSRVGVPIEERMLQSQFGDAYSEYRRRVPRWVKRPLAPR